MHPSILGTALEPTAVADYLERHGFPGATILQFEPVGVAASDVKAGGYGKPIRVRFTSQGREHDTVLRTTVADDFGHDRRSDRYQAAILGFDSFSELPGHCRPIAVGTVRPDGSLVDLGMGEPFLLTSFETGSIYIKDLFRLAKEDSAPALDQERASALGIYLGKLHQTEASARAYRRFVRDTLGSGEGVFGLADAYPADDPVAPPARLMALEKAWIEWRWRLKDRTDRCRRTHGDFHPFNILFSDGTGLKILDASRGIAGDPADDVTALTINYLFFSLLHRGRFDGALRQLWSRVFESYGKQRSDPELMDVVGPFYAWRALVLACPAWYPEVADAHRDTMLRFAERLLAGETFDPDRVETLLR